MAKIMLVEDDNNLREIYGERLMAEGYEIISASNGEEALAIAVKERPDLIISDVMMPKISGFDMLDILRQTPETKNTKIVMMTALSQLDDKARADRLGADKYLVKSQVTLEDVARVVHDILNGPVEPAPANPVAVAPPTPAIATATPIAAPASPQPAPAQPEPSVAAVVVTTAPTVAPIPEPQQTTASIQPTVAPIAVAAPPRDPQPADTPLVTTDVNETEAEPSPVEKPQPAITMPANSVTPVVVTPAAVPDTPDPALNPATVEPASDPVATPPPSGGANADPTTATPQSIEQEVDAVAEQIESFLHSNTPAAAHSEPLVDPTVPIASNSPATAPVSGTKQPTPANAPSSYTPQAEAEPPSDPTVPTIQDTTSVDVPTIPSQRKKVIAPINNPIEEPSIYELYEKEMAEEAASAPPTGEESVVSKSANPLTAEMQSTTPPPLETLDPSELGGLHIESDDNTSTPTIVTEATPVALSDVQPAQTPAVDSISGTQTTSAASEAAQPTNPGAPATDPKDPSNIAL